MLNNIASIEWPKCTANNYHKYPWNTWFSTINIKSYPPLLNWLNYWVIFIIIHYMKKS